MRIIGLDLSLTATGVAIHDTETGLTTCHTIGTTGTADATLTDRHRRQVRMEHALMDLIDDGNTHPALTVIEAPAFSRVQGHQHDRSGLWWRMVDRLLTYFCPVAEIGPSVLKKYATGKDNASKDQVLLAVPRRYPTVDVTTNDEADALVLCAMGSRHLGWPIDQMPQTHLDAMGSVAWPEVTT